MVCAEHVYNFGYEWYIIISLLDAMDQSDPGPPPLPFWGFWMLCRRLVGFLGRETRPSQDLDLHRTGEGGKKREKKEKAQKCKLAKSEIRTHDDSMRGVEDNTAHWSRGQCERRMVYNWSS